MKKVIKAYVSAATREKLMDTDDGEEKQLWVYVGKLEHHEPGDRLMTIKIQG